MQKSKRYQLSKSHQLRPSYVGHATAPQHGQGQRLADQFVTKTYPGCHCPASARRGEGSVVGKSKNEAGETGTGLVAKRLRLSFGAPRSTTRPHSAAAVASYRTSPRRRPGVCPPAASAFRRSGAVEADRRLAFEVKGRKDWRMVAWLVPSPNSPQNLAAIGRPRNIGRRPNVIKASPFVCCVPIR